MHYNSTSFAAGKNVTAEFRKGHRAPVPGRNKGYDYDIPAPKKAEAHEYL